MHVEQFNIILDGCTTFSMPDRQTNTFHQETKVRFQFKESRNSLLILSLVNDTRYTICSHFDQGEIEILIRVCLIIGHKKSYSVPCFILRYVKKLTTHYPFFSFAQKFQSALSKTFFGATRFFYPYPCIFHENRSFFSLSSCLLTKSF